uniref:Uncharacterized protein n=1 Tax=Hyaloperonospora arabidopsidis (strain Emoy2) TaxID=559515 RepID=M4BIP3_HYAAE
MRPRGASLELSLKNRQRCRKISMVSKNTPKSCEALNNSAIANFHDCSESEDKS